MWLLRSLLSGVARDRWSLVVLAGVLAVVSLVPHPSAASHVVPDLAGAFEGFGATTSGGPGSTTVHVTTLADSVSPIIPGSLREALSQGNRYVVFDVAGDIVLQGPLWVKKPFITIDGFTAPAPGITLVGQALAIRGPHAGSSDDGHDIIVRGIRVRDSIEDNFQIAYGGHNVVFDHVSSAGAGDGTLDVTFDSHDITVSWSVLALPASGKSVLIKYGAARVTFHHNLFVRGNQRNPAAAVDDDGTPATDTTVDVRNNVVWGWINYGTMIHHGARANVVANVYSSPTANNGVQKQALIVCRGDGDCFADTPAIAVTSAAEAFVQDNLSSDPITIDLNAERTTATPFDAAPVATEDPCLAARRVLTEAGVRPLDGRDAALLAPIALPVCTTTATSIATSPNPSGFTEPVTLTATVTPTAATALPVTGTARFLVGSTLIGSATVNSGVGTITTSLLPAGRHDVVAVYDGDGWYQPSASTSLAQVVSVAVPTTTELTSSANPTTIGQPVTLTALVRPLPPSLGPATGTVRLRDGSLTLATVPLVNGAATFTTSALGPGWRSLTAAYNGDTSFSASTSAVLSLGVDGGTQVTLTAAPASARFGQPVTLTALVVAVPPADGAPTGTVILRDGTTALASVPVVGGAAMWTTSALTVKNHTLTALYAGDGSYAPSTSPSAGVTVTKGSTLTTVVSSSLPVSAGTPVTLTATVQPQAPASGTPTGTVKFKDGATTIGTVTVSGGVATLTATLPPGVRSLTASYTGDVRFETSTSPVLAQPVAGGSTVTVASLLNPAIVGQAVTLTVTVTPLPPSTGVPTGTVTFRDGTTVLGTKSLLLGLAALTVPGFNARTHAITATYEGDTVYVRTTSAPVSQVVKKGATATTLTTSDPSIVQGTSVTFTARVTAVAPAAGTPGGRLKFMAGSTVLGTATFSGGVAHLTTTKLATGHYQVTAQYAGDGNFTASTSLAVSEDVTP